MVGEDREMRRGKGEWENGGRGKGKAKKERYVGLSGDECKSIRK